MARCNVLVGGIDMDGLGVVCPCNSISFSCSNLRLLCINRIIRIHIIQINTNNAMTKYTICAFLSRFKKPDLDSASESDPDPASDSSVVDVDLVTTPEPSLSEVLSTFPSFCDENVVSGLFLPSEVVSTVDRVVEKSKKRCIVDVNMVSVVEAGDWTGNEVVGEYVVGLEVVGADVVGSAVVGAIVVGAIVVGALVVGATVLGDGVVGADVDGLAVVGVLVVGDVVVGLPVVGLVVVGLAVVGFAVVGAAVVGLADVGFAVVGVAVTGLLVVGFAVDGIGTVGWDDGAAVGGIVSI